jgi:hypothetical protein
MAFGGASVRDALESAVVAITRGNAPENVWMFCG